MSTRTAEFKYVFFDLETTGLRQTDPDILHIGAIDSKFTDSFDKFVKPRKVSTTAASENINKLRYDQITQQLYVVYKESKKLCKSDWPEIVFKEFLQWLAKVGQGSKVILIAYNAKGFDAPVLLLNLQYYGLKNAFIEVCEGFSDPLVASKEFYPQLRSKSLENMLKHFHLMALDDSSAHNGMIDANNLKRLTFRMFTDINKSSGTRNDLPFPTWQNFILKYFIHVSKIPH